MKPPFIPEYTNHSNFLRVVLFCSFTILQITSCRVFSSFDNPDTEQSVYQVSALGVRTASDDWNDRRSILENLLETNRSNKCEATWKKVTDDGIIKIYILLGYDDAEFQGNVFAMDGNFREVLSNYLTKPCQGSYQACGFRQTSNTDGKIFLKKSVPDFSTGTDIPVEITMVSSAVKISNSDNIGPFRREQEAKTAVAEALFAEGIEQGDVVYYSGHARDGGGPDFSPPHGAHGHPDYDWYHAHKPGLKFMLSKLDSSTIKIQQLGLFACSSVQWFKSKVLATAPNISFIGSHQTTEKSPIDIAMVSALDSVLNFRCQDNFTKAIDVSRGQKFSISNFTD